MAAEPPAGTVTFLITAVDNSSRRWGETPDAAAAAVERHDVIVRDAIERHDGYVFAIGDGGVAATFATAVDAAEAAVELQCRVFAEREWIGFDVRVGLHTGEAGGGGPR
ncbi:MAG: hypothetical protein ABIP19_15040 [Dermatophilaceae bacterium]